MKRISWILGSVLASALVACGDRSPGGDADTETGSPGMAADTAPAVSPMDTAMTDTTSTTRTGADTTVQ